MSKKKKNEKKASKNKNNELVDAVTTNFKPRESMLSVMKFLFKKLYIINNKLLLLCFIDQNYDYNK